MRFQFVFIAALALAGCAPEPQARDISKDANGGVDIIPPAILASEKLVPATQPANDFKDLIQALSESNQNHEKVLRALRLSGLVPELREAGPYTLFAPTDEAFSKLPPGTFDRLLQPQNRQQLRALMQYHLLKGRIDFKTMLDTNGTVPATSGQSLVIKGIDHKVMVNDANVIRSTDTASNGIIHWTDSVLLPPAHG